jgi:hypothetical protein
MMVRIREWKAETDQEKINMMDRLPLWIDIKMMNWYNLWEEGTGWWYIKHKENK